MRPGLFCIAEQLCSASVGSLVLLKRFPPIDRCPPTERRTYAGEPLHRLARGTPEHPLFEPEDLLTARIVEMSESVRRMGISDEALQQMLNRT